MNETFAWRWLGRLNFQEALAWQEELVAKKRENRNAADELLLLEHEPVYTIGRTPDQSSLVDAAHLPHPLFAINRGGQATYHGPGQLIGYPKTRPGLTGVWIENRKIASIGVGVRYWVTMHGFALNVCGDLTPFDRIIPCGIQNVTMTSIEKETGTIFSSEEVGRRVAEIAFHTIANLTTEGSLIQISRQPPTHF